MPDESLLLVLDEVRAKTLGVLASVSEQDARWAPPGLQNTILWHAGHAYILLECLSMQALGRTPEIPHGWFQLFSWESHPANTPADRWPTLAEIIAKLKQQHERMKTLIEALSDQALAHSAADHPEVPVRYAILHALHDEACHCGEIQLLRKLLRQIG
jgi:hypothetical protein